MKKLLYILIIIAGLFLLQFALVQGATTLFPYQGGTGIGTVGVGDVGKCLIVSDNVPFTYTVGECGTGGGGGGGFPLYVQNDGATLNTATTTLNFTANSFSLVEDPTDTFAIRVATSTLGLLASAISDFVSTVRTSISETITGLTYTSGTGVLSLDSGYTIPTTTREVNQDTAFSWGNHASAGYLNSASIDTSSELATIVTDETGSGALVFATSPSIVSPTLSTFFGTPCTGNQFLQDISDTGAFTCVTATGGSSFTVTSTTTPSWRSTLQGWTFPDGQKMNEDIENNYFHTIKPIWFHVVTDGTHTLRDSGTYGTFGYNASNTELIRENSTEQFVTSSGSDPDIHVLTASPTLSATAIAQMVGFATSSHFTGIELDWEGFNSWTATETANYFAFVDKLSKSAHANGLKTMIYVPPIWNTAANRESGSGDEWDSANSSSYYTLTYDMVNKSSADYIVIPAYDYQFDYSNDRPNAPLKWMQDIANFAKSKITDHDRLIMGMPAAVQQVDIVRLGLLTMMLQL